MNHARMRQFVFTGLLTAIAVVLGRFFLIPVPWTHGNVNLCDLGIMLAGLLLGPVAGGITGGLSGMLLDLISGYAAYAPFSLIVHGLEGFMVGWIYKRTNNQYLALGLGIVVMVAGYFVADSVLYKVIAGFLGIGTNLVQGLAGAVVTVLVLNPLQRTIRVR